MHILNLLIHYICCCSVDILYLFNLSYMLRKFVLKSIFLGTKLYIKKFCFTHICIVLYIVKTFILVKISTKLLILQTQ